MPRKKENTGIVGPKAVIKLKPIEETPQTFSEDLLLNIEKMVNYGGTVELDVTEETIASSERIRLELKALAKKHGTKFNICLRNTDSAKTYNISCRDERFKEIPRPPSQSRLRRQRRLCRRNGVTAWMLYQNTLSVTPMTTEIPRPPTKSHCRRRRHNDVKARMLDQNTLSVTPMTTESPGSSTRSSNLLCKDTMTRKRDQNPGSVTAMTTKSPGSSTRSSNLLRKDTMTRKRDQNPGSVTAMTTRIPRSSSKSRRLRRIDAKTKKRDQNPGSVTAMTTGELPAVCYAPLAAC